jgi:hypothetical protein
MLGSFVPGQSACACLSAQNISTLEPCWPWLSAVAFLRNDVSLSCVRTQLLALLDAHALEPGVVLLAAPALARVLMGAREAALAAMHACGALPLLAGVVTRQGRARASALARISSLGPLSPSRTAAAQLQPFRGRSESACSEDVPVKGLIPALQGPYRAAQRQHLLKPAIASSALCLCTRQARRRQSGPEGSNNAQDSTGEEETWQARCAVLSALATYLHAAPAVQRAAVHSWEPVAALFGLLWDGATRRIALSMVRFLFCSSASLASCWSLPGGHHAGPDRHHAGPCLVGIMLVSTWWSSCWAW